MSREVHDVSMILNEGIELADHFLTTPTPLLAGHTVGGVLIAGGAVGLVIYGAAKVAKAGFREIGVID